MEKEQMSTPLPAMALNIPPRNPTKRRTSACQTPKLTIESKVFLLRSLKCFMRFFMKKEFSIHKTYSAERVKMQN